ncbi:hypothetical protein BTR19_19695 [Pseudomonas fluorescens]|nr:hypothetical protein BTR19_19695 [Pseudomonas fluorescens]
MKKNIIMVEQITFRAFDGNEYTIKGGRGKKPIDVSAIMAQYAEIHNNKDLIRAGYFIEQLKEGWLKYTEILKKEQVPESPEKPKTKTLKPSKQKTPQNICEKIIFKVDGKEYTIYTRIGPPTKILADLIEAHSEYLFHGEKLTKRIFVECLKAGKVKNSEILSIETITPK